jgi:hypothetical protein
MALISSSVVRIPKPASFSFADAMKYRDQSERLRGLAAKAKGPAVQRDYEELASEWDMMAEQIEMLCRDSQKPAA